MYRIRDYKLYDVRPSQDYEMRRTRNLIVGLILMVASVGVNTYLMNNEINDTPILENNIKPGELETTLNGVDKE